MASGANEPVGWYISHRNGNSMGPLTDADMRHAIGRGRIKPDDHVWRDGMNGWAEAREIPNFEDVRRSFRKAAERAGRGTQPHREPRQPQSAQPRLPSYAQSRLRAQNVPATKGARPHPKSARSSDNATARSDVQDWLDRFGKAKAGSDATADLEKKLGEVTAKIGRVPPGAIAFLVLGLTFTPFLPIFWFIAWRIWAKANR